jgi:hypothetical protein
MPERKGVLTIIDDRLRRRNAKAKRSLAEIASATSQKFREQRNRAPLSLSARGPFCLPGLCAAAHKVTPLNHSRDLDTLLRNFFVSFCLGSKAAKAKGLFRRRTSISRRGPEATEIWIVCFRWIDNGFISRSYSNHLVPRRRKSASKDALVRSDVTESWAMLPRRRASALLSTRSVGAAVPKPPP